MGTCDALVENLVKVHQLHDIGRGITWKLFKMGIAHGKVNGLVLFKITIILNFLSISIFGITEEEIFLFLKLCVANQLAISVSPTASQIDTVVNNVSLDNSDSPVFSVVPPALSEETMSEIRSSV